MSEQVTQRCRVEDARGFDPKSVAIAHHLGSDKHGDYRLIEDWIKRNDYGQYRVDTLVELFDREVGLQMESPRPQQAREH